MGFGFHLFDENAGDVRDAAELERVEHVHRNLAQKVVLRLLIVLVLVLLYRFRV